MSETTSTTSTAPAPVADNTKPLATEPKGRTGAARRVGATAGRAAYREAVEADVIRGRARAAWGGGASIGSSRYGGSFWGAGTARGTGASPSAGFNADVPAAIAKNRVQPQKEIVAVSVGDKVNHTSFGNGTVLAVEGAGDKTVAKVKFTVGEKRLLLRYAPLTKIDA